jgi:hypothetical protein
VVAKSFIEAGTSADLSAMRWEFSGKTYRIGFTAGTVGEDGATVGRLVASAEDSDQEEPLLLDAHARQDVVVAAYWSFVLRDQVRHLGEFFRAYREVSKARLEC